MEHAKRGRAAHRGSSTASLNHLFEMQAAKTPDHIALKSDAKSVTYRELKEFSDRVASFLVQAKVANGALIGIQIERSILYHSIVLGVLKAGCTVVPLPPNYPRSKLTDIVVTSGLKHVIVQNAQDLELLPGVKVILTSALEASKAKCELPVVDPQATAFVLSSSGSTGKPKLIVRSHSSFLHRLNWTWTNHPYQQGEVCCQKSHMSTTHSIYELFEPLLSGVMTVVIADDEVRDAQRLTEIVRTEGISRLLLVPSLLQVLMEVGNRDFRRIRVLVLMGEAVHKTFAQRVVREFPAATQIFSIYGSTEASSSLVCDIRKHLDSDSPLPLGEPISPDIHVHILDDNAKPIVTGEVGTLFLSGPCLFHGYLGQPELTKSKLREIDGVLAYNTSDKVRLAQGNQVEFIGRSDNTVKIRGFRVDLEEVEEKLKAMHGVQHCAVVVRKTLDPQIVAFLTPADADCKAIRKDLIKHLAEYMIPAQFIALEKLPVTASGKIDRVSLADFHPAPSRGEKKRDLDSATGQAVQKIWQEVTGVGSIGADDNFFEVGGNSLSAFLALNKLSKFFEIEIPIRAIFENPVLSQFAMEIERRQKTSTPSKRSVDALTEGRKNEMIVSFDQIFYHMSRSSFKNATQMLLNAKILGRIDFDVWKRSFEILAQRYEGLRTTFKLENGVLTPVIHDQLKIYLELNDIRSDSEAEQNRKIQEWATADAFMELDFEKGPLWRARVVQCKDDLGFLIMGFDHTIMDNWSKQILYNEIVDIYDKVIKGENPQDSVSRPQYLEYARWQRSLFSELELERRKNILAHYHPRACKERAARAIDRGSPLRSKPFQMPVCSSAKEFDELNKFCLKHKITVPILLQAAMGVVLAPLYENNEMVMIAVSLFNRHIFPRTIGPMLGLFPIRFGLDKHSTAEELLLATKNANIDAQDFGFPPGVFTKMFGDKVISNHCFNFLTEENEQIFKSDSLTLASQLMKYTAERPAHNDRIHTEWIFKQDQNNTITCTIWYLSNAFSGISEVEEMAANFQKVLAWIVADPTKSLRILAA